MQQKPLSPSLNTPKHRLASQTPSPKHSSSWSLVGVHPASTSHGPFPRWSEGLRVHPVGTPARIHDSHCSQGAAIYDGDGNIAQGYCNMWRQIEIGLRI